MPGLSWPLLGSAVGQEWGMVGLNSAVAALVLVCGLALASLPVSADSPPASAGLSMNEAASRVQQRFGGELISIRPAEQDGERGWQATVLLDNGRVKTLFVVARTGAVVDRRRN